MRRFKTVGLLNLISRIKPQALIKVMLVKTVLDLCGCLVLLASCGRVSEVVSLPSGHLFFPESSRDCGMFQNCLSRAISFIWEKVQPSNMSLLPTSSAIRPPPWFSLDSSCPIAALSGVLCLICLAHERDV